MPQDSLRNKSDFDLMLSWLDRDRELAANKYELIRSKLTRLFVSRGCFAPDELADETIERVTRKIREILPGYQGEPTRYFYGVARNVFLEYTRKPPTCELPNKLSFLETDSEEAELRDRCLGRCLRRLNPEQSDFIIEYYKKQGSEKVLHRKKLAEKLGISQRALRVRAFRIRAELQDCMFRLFGK